MRIYQPIEGLLGRRRRTKRYRMTFGLFGVIGLGLILYWALFAYPDRAAQARTDRIISLSAPDFTNVLTDADIALLADEPSGEILTRRTTPDSVEGAIERYRNPDRELLAVLQLFRRSNQIIDRYEIEEGPKVYETERNGKRFEMYNDTIIAFNRAGDEIFRTQVEEPFYVRPNKHANTI